MSKAGHVHLSELSNEQLTAIANERKNNNKLVDTKKYIVAELINKCHKREVK